MSSSTKVASHIPSRGGGSFVTNVQYGNANMAGAATSNTATITSVDTTKSVVVWLGEASNIADQANTGGSSYGWVVLTNSTTVTVNRTGNLGGGDSVTIYFAVISFGVLMKSLQTGSIGMNDATNTNTATITSVNASKTTLFFQGHKLAGSNNNRDVFIGFTLTNATTVTANRLGAADVGNTGTGYFGVVEHV